MLHVHERNKGGMDFLLFINYSCHPVCPQADACRLNPESGARSVSQTISKQVIDILRQAFSDQQDGHARAEAVSSLLLSEQHLQQETTSSTSTLSTGTGTAWRAPTRASVVEEFLRARQAFKIDANGSAAAHHCVATGLVPPSVGGAMATASVGRSLSAASEEGTEPEAGVSVTSVLREMGQKRRSRLRQVLRRRYGQQKHHRYRQRSRRKHITRAEMSNCSAGTAVESGLFDRLSEDRYNEKHEGEGEGKRRATRKSNGVDGMSSRSRPWHPMWEHVKNGTQPSTKGTEEETGGGQDEEASFVTRLALAASVSMIDGLLSNNMDVEREGVSFCPESVSHRCGVSDGSGGNSSTGGVGRDDDLREAVRGCERMGLPLLLVQSTEDALIGTPLPLLLEQEVRIFPRIVRPLTHSTSHVGLHGTLNHSVEGKVIGVKSGAKDKSPMNGADFGVFLCTCCFQNSLQRRTYAVHP